MLEFVANRWIEMLFAGIFILYVIFLWRVSKAELNRDMKIYRSVYEKNLRNDNETDNIKKLKEIKK